MASGLELAPRANPAAGRASEAGRTQGSVAPRTGVERGVPSRLSLPPCSPAELRALVLGGENDSDACEWALAQVARAQGAVELAIGDGLAALTVGDRLITLGSSCLKDYAREVLGIGERKAQALAQLSRELERRPQLRAAVVAGEVRIRHAQAVLPVALGDAEASWVERARAETVRALEAAVREARGADVEPEEEWTRFQARLSDKDRAVVDEALEIARHVLPAPTRADRLEAMAQEYLGEHPLEAGDDGAGGAGVSFTLERERRAHAAAQEERAERESEAWIYLDAPSAIPAPAAGFDASSTAWEIDAALRALAAERDAWDDRLGALAYLVKRTGLWRTAGFDSFDQYCRERLGLAPRTVEQRVALEQRLWASPALRAARDDAGLSYEKLRILSGLPDAEIEGWVPRARALTCVELRAALSDQEDAQLRAARKLRARLPSRVAELLQAAFRAARAVEGCLLDDGKCLVRVARHFADTWRAHVKKARTVSQKVRRRDGCRCQVPGCSRRAVHAHHIVSRSRGGSDDDENLVSLCAFHHLRGVHGGHLRVSGRAPDGLTWEIGPRRAPVDLRRWLGLVVSAPGSAARAA
jgi:hypothetical protein